MNQNLSKRYEQMSLQQAKFNSKFNFTSSLTGKLVSLHSVCESEKRPTVNRKGFMDFLHFELLLKQILFPIYERNNIIRIILCILWHKALRCTS